MTYSIVARDPATGELGVAVQSHWFSVGSLVTWAEAGTGAVATQSFAEPSYGPLGLDLMRAGKSAPDALAALLAVDREGERRQVAMIDARGEVAAHTGAGCVAAAGHELGEGFSCQANLMEHATVWGAMAETYRSASGDLRERLLDTLDAAEAEAGDIRGRQSAAILVVRSEASGDRYRETICDLRVEDHPEPVPELRRLVELGRAYDRMEQAEELILEGDADGALALYVAAEELGIRHAPDNAEFSFWRAVMLANAGRLEEARAALRPVYGRDPRWRELVGRVAAAGLLPPEAARDLVAD
ncbi:MAG: DUF1028 domain-containing protein [Actinomycetota bacterium]